MEPRTLHSAPPTPRYRGYTHCRCTPEQRWGLAQEAARRALDGVPGAAGWLPRYLEHALAGERRAA